jgi:uncharacterized SAM-binding protein YcdF (DUF218 family)
MLLIITYSPIDLAMMRYLEKEDTLRACPAVVVLSCGQIDNGAVPLAYLSRIVHGYDLLKRGYAQRLVISEVDASGGNYKYVSRQMHDLGLSFPIDSIGIARNTHDEALGAARLAKSRHWDRVILVTQSFHQRRASAVFDKAGLKVIASPSLDDLNHWGDPQGVIYRVFAFQNCLHEIIGYWVYQRRGWI